MCPGHYLKLAGNSAGVGSHSAHIMVVSQIIVPGVYLSVRSSQFK